MKLKLFSIVLVIFHLGACVSQKQLIYFQDLPLTLNNIPQNINTLKTGDIIAVTVNSVSPDAANFFNNTQQKSGSENNPSMGYLVNSNGGIDLPILGSIAVNGLTVDQLQLNITNQLEKYLVKPIVNIRLTNFKITLLGEFNKPGLYLVENGNIDLLEALGLGNDLNIYANRTLTLIREENNKKEFYKINLTNKSQFTSKLYLKSGDILYAEPMKGKKASAENFYKIVPIVTSAITLLVLIFVNTK